MKTYLALQSAKPEKHLFSVSNDSQSYRMLRSHNRLLTTKQVFSTARAGLFPHVQHIRQFFGKFQSAFLLSALFVGEATKSEIKFINRPSVETAETRPRNFNRKLLTLSTINNRKKEHQKLLGECSPRNEAEAKAF